MSHIKLEALALECSKREISLKILQNSLENSCAEVSFIIKVQAESIKPNFYVHNIPAQVFLKTFKNAFENTNSFVEHLQTAAPVKRYL